MTTQKPTEPTPWLTDAELLTPMSGELDARRFVADLATRKALTWARDWLKDSAFAANGFGASGMAIAYYKASDFLTDLLAKGGEDDTKGKG